MKIKLTTFDVGVRRGQIDFVFTLSKLIFNDTIIVSKVEIFRVLFHFVLVLFYNFIDKLLTLESKQGGRGSPRRRVRKLWRRFFSVINSLILILKRPWYIPFILFANNAPLLPRRACYIFKPIKTQFLVDLNQL